MCVNATVNVSFVLIMKEKIFYCRDKSINPQNTFTLFTVHADISYLLVYIFFNTVYYILAIKHVLLSRVRTSVYHTTVSRSNIYISIALSVDNVVTFSTKICHVYGIVYFASKYILLEKHYLEKM